MKTTQRFFRLKPISRFNGWPTFETNIALVVRAPSEMVARQLAAQSSAAEGTQPWLNADMTSCEELTLEDDNEVILVYYLGS